MFNPIIEKVFLFLGLALILSAIGFGLYACGKSNEANKINAASTELETKSEYSAKEADRHAKEVFDKYGIKSGK